MIKHGQLNLRQLFTPRLPNKSCPRGARYTFVMDMPRYAFELSSRMYGFVWQSKKNETEKKLCDGFAVSRKRREETIDNNICDHLYDP